MGVEVGALTGPLQGTYRRIATFTRERYGRAGACFTPPVTPEVTIGPAESLQGP